MGVARPGLLVAGGVLACLGILFLSFAFHWFPFMLLAFGILAVGLAFAEGAPDRVAAANARSAPASPVDDASLRTALAELDQMLMDHVLSPAEHKRKRQQLIDAWAMPRPPV